MPHIFLTVDLGFGDAGKGSIVDYLARAHSAHTVVRYNGGAQAAHRVVAAQGEHIFSQFGSGALAGAATHLSRFMLLDPLAMREEARHLQALGVADPFGTTTIDAGALVITPFARAINRLRELARGAGRHGSCGIGIGETVSDHLAHGERALFAGDLADPDRLATKLRFLRELALAKLGQLNLLDRCESACTCQVGAPARSARCLIDEELEPLLDPDWLDWTVEAFLAFARVARIVPGDYLRRVLGRPGAVIFEGAQGALLDEWRGFHPHTTWSTTTLANADRLLAEAGHAGPTARIGITRAYTTRHGAGPMPSEDAELTRRLPDARNQAHPWQQGFRVGWLDLVLLRYARAVVGPLDMLALTCLDRLAELPDAFICPRYSCDGATIESLPLAENPQDLVHQERLTATLLRCRPQLEPLGSPEALIARLGAELGAPVGITSWGPAAEAKSEVIP